MALAQLAYVSRRVDALCPETLEQIVGRARVRNAQRRISGVLICRGTHLLQLLEGDLEDVVALYDTIRGDPRHADVHCVMFRNVKRRMFPDCGMEMAALESAGTAARDRLARVVKDVVSRTDTWPRCPQGRLLLNDFREQLATAA